MIIYPVLHRRPQQQHSDVTVGRNADSQAPRYYLFLHYIFKNSNYHHPADMTEPDLNPSYVFLCEDQHV